MNVKIGGREYELRFSLDAINYLDHVYTIDANGVKIGDGIQELTVYLNLRNPTALYHAIKAGTIREKQKPSNEEIETFLEEAGENGGLEKLADDFLSLLRRQPLTKAAVKAFEEAAGANPEETPEKEAGKPVTKAEKPEKKG